MVNTTSSYEEAREDRANGSSTSYNVKPDVMKLQGLIDKFTRGSIDERYTGADKAAEAHIRATS